MPTGRSRIIQIVQHLAPGGIETLALELHRTFREQHDSLLISLEGNYASASAHWPRLTEFQHELIFLDKQPGLQPSLLARLYRLLRQQKPDVVHTHHIGPLLYGALAGRLAKVPCLVHTEHDAWHLENPKRRKLAALLCQLGHPHLVADSEQVASAMRQYLPGCQPEVILNGIDTTRFTPADHHRRIAARQALQLPLDVPLIGCAARLEAVKGHSNLLQALSQSLTLCPSLHLVLAGTGSLDAALRQQAAALGLHDRVHFAGLLSDMTAFYHALDGFCLASQAEGLPLSPLEAQACNVPVVLTDVGGCRECTEPSTGQLVPYGDIPALAAALQRCVSQPASTVPRQFVERHASLASMAAHYLRLYQISDTSGARLCGA